MCELFQDSGVSYLGAYILDFCPPELHCGREWSISQTATDVDAPPRRRQRRMNREKTDPKDRIQSALVVEVEEVVEVEVEVEVIDRADRIAAAPTISSSSRSSSSSEDSAATHSEHISNQRRLTKYESICFEDLEKKYSLWQL